MTKATVAEPTESAKHTPVQWTVADGKNGLDGNGRVIVQHEGSDFRHVATVYAAYADREAHARLIAAAPDLLKVAHWALARLVSMSDLSDDKSEAAQLQVALRAAIAKAEGKA